MSSFFSSSRSVSRPDARTNVTQFWKSTSSTRPDCWPHAICGPAGICTVIWFLILAAFNSFLQMETTVGKIELLLLGRCNMHVCLISHRREEDDAVQIVMNLDFMKSPPLLETRRVKWYFTVIEQPRFFFIRVNWMWIFEKWSCDINCGLITAVDCRRHNLLPENSLI